MNFSECQTQLANHAEVIQALVTDVTEEQARWKPRADEWSILEVVNHLYDEEREDFRTRLDLLLHHPGKPWPAIDPQGWVTARRYNERDLNESLHHFLAERQQSLIWLENLEEPNWGRAEKHPVAGRFTAGDMLAAWVAHDVLHLRQLVELKWQIVADLVRPYDPGYAGDW